MTPSPGSQARGWLWAVQGLVTLAVVAFVARSIGRNWAEVRSLHAVLAIKPLRLAAAGVAALASVGVLTWAPTARWLGRLAGTAAPLEPLRPTAVVVSATLTALGWVTYGAAFWLLARGLIADRVVPFAVATGVFALGYILGWLALFAPGGVGVRELVFVSLLTPWLGSGGALVVSLASRVLLTAMEAAAAVVTLPLRHRPQGSTSERA